jgi:hypothetical protein
MIREYDCVALGHDIAEAGLKTGDVGAVVFVHGKGEAFEVEFVGADGRTLALLTLKADEVLPLSAGSTPSHPDDPDTGLLDASNSSLGFWDNADDDREWDGA